MNCKNCAHYDVCSFWTNYDNPIEKLYNGCEFAIIIPCVIGDKVYHNSEVFGILEYSIQAVYGSALGVQMEAFAYDTEEIELLDAIDFETEDIGKTVFLTREEAEKAMQKECNNE